MGNGVRVRTLSTQMRHTQTTPRQSSKTDWSKTMSLSFPELPGLLARIVAPMAVVLVWETEEAGIILEMATRGRAVTFIKVLTDIVDVLCQRGNHERTAGPFSWATGAQDTVVWDEVNHSGNIGLSSCDVCVRARNRNGDKDFGDWHFFIPLYGLVSQPWSQQADKVVPTVPAVRLRMS